MLWFRRDLRLGDHPALREAAEAGPDGVLGLFVLDPKLWSPAGPARRGRLAASLRALNDSLGGKLLIRRGDPAAVVPAVAEEVGARTVHVSADYGPYGRRRDEQAADALRHADVELLRTGSPYAVAPGRVRKPDGDPYRVWTPFYRGWVSHGWRSPASTDADTADWLPPPAGDAIPEPTPDQGQSAAAGEAAARQRWDQFRDAALSNYGADRNRPDLDGTSRLSAALRWGEIHPRTLLADLDDSEGAEVFRRELAWREFYADVLWHAPDSARNYWRPQLQGMRFDAGPTADDAFTAWTQGRTGYPFVDAGMRQLLHTGWMHNRVRMVTASFLVKDLHQEWTRGAAWFMRNLIDGDLASNQHGWQWVAGTGTDAAPYFRVFNPVTQGRRFDPDGDYVRQWVPELRGVPGPAVHEPWAHPAAAEYPEPIVDHAAERDEALLRYREVAGP